MTFEIKFSVQFLMLFQKIKPVQVHDDIGRSNSKKIVWIIQAYNDGNNICQRVKKSSQNDTNRQL